MRERRGDSRDNENERIDEKWSGSSDILGCGTYSGSSRARVCTRVAEDDDIRRLCCCLADT